MNMTISQDKYVDTHTTSGKHFKIALNLFWTSKHISSHFGKLLFHTCEHSMETWSQEQMDNLRNNGSMTFDKFTCTKTALGGHFQLTSQTPVFNTWSEFSFVLTMQNINFPIFGRLIFFIWDHDKTTWRYGWIVNSPRNISMLPDEFYHQYNPSLRAFENSFSISRI